MAGQVLGAQEAQQLAVIGIAGEGDPGDAGAGQGFPEQRRAHLLIPHGEDVLVARIGVDHRRPALDQSPALGREPGLGFHQQAFQGGDIPVTGGDETGDVA